MYRFRRCFILLREDRSKYSTKSVLQSVVVFFLCRCQQRIKQPGSLLFADILRMAVGSFQKGGICVSQQVGCHLLAGAMFQQIGGEEMPHDVQVVFLRESVFIVQPPQTVAESIGVYRLAFSLEDQPVPVGPVVFQGLLGERS